jgi:hypothetical protein
MKAESANAMAKENLKAVCWFSSAMMRDVLARSLSLRYETMSIPLRAATWAGVSRQVWVSLCSTESQYEDSGRGLCTWISTIPIPASSTSVLENTLTNIPATNPVPLY